MNKIEYAAIKKWLFNQIQVSAQSIEDDFKINKTDSKLIFEKLKKDKFIFKATEKKDIWLVSQNELLQDKKGNWPDDLSQSVKSNIKRIEVSHEISKKYYKYLNDSSYFQNFINPDMPVQFLDPIEAFIFSCNMKYNTILVSDILDNDFLTVLLISKISKIPVGDILSGILSETHWPKLIQAAAFVSSCSGHLKSYPDKAISGSQLIGLFKNPKYEVIILDLKSNHIKMTNVIFEVAKQNKKILIFSNIRNED